MKGLFVLLGLAVAAHAGDARAAIRLPRLVGDDMVLQRDVPLILWGWADPGERVAVEFNGERTAAKADAWGQWRVTLPAMRAGGPYAMSLRGTRARVTLKNILLGDVWLAAGQSNMAFPLVAQKGFGGVTGAEHEMPIAENSELRLLQLRAVPASTPQTDVESTGWHVAGPASVGPFSAVAYLFGRELQQRYAVPIGLIDATCGGTPAEAWIGAESLHEFPELEAEAHAASSLPATAEQDYAEYLRVKAAWYPLHGREDRGMIGRTPVWASLNFDDSRWPVVKEPQPWPRKALKNFDGTLWFRKTLDLPAASAGSSLRVHLGRMLQADATYFNGALIGATIGEIDDRNYAVPAELVRAGRNVVTVRLTGAYKSGEGFVGMHGEAEYLYVDLGTGTLPLSGFWSVQAGPDLSGLPDPPALAALRDPVPRAPAVLFNGMIAPLARFKIKGVIWYQGESNVGRAAEYATLFPTLIENWRAVWGYAMPFAYVQLAGFGHDRPEPWNAPAAALREAQSRALSLPETRMATAVDVGEENDIHPKNKQAVAHRLMLAVANLAYGAPGPATGPTFAASRVEGSTIRVTFTNTATGLQTSASGASVKGFAIASANGGFVWASASIDGNSVIVSNSSIQEPAAVRYDWASTPNGNLYGGDGLPALPFRTDGAYDLPR